MDHFEDHFSQKARDYARYRPGYPVELFAYLASLAPHHRLAWDCGTGSGQAAVALVDYFDGVIATDPSADLLAQAAHHPRIEYRLERAEEPSLEAGSVGLATAALAVHWFDLDRFYDQVRRVLSPGGTLAVWCYHFPVITPAVDRIVERYYHEVVSRYWPERFSYLEEHYRTLPFPFDEISPPRFEMQAEWDLAQFMGYVDSWSATRRFEAARGYHPLKEVWAELAEAWGEPTRRAKVRWEVYMRVGKMTDPS